MDSAKLVTQLLLAVASLSAAAHRPALPKQHPVASKHKSATAKHRKSVSSKRHSAQKHRPQKHHSPSAKHSVAGKRHAARERRTVAALHRPAEHRARQQPVAKTYTVTATVYQAVASQTDSNPFLTADNSRIKPHYGSKMHWLALSRDLLAQGGGKFQYGDKVHVGGVSPELDGVYTVHDTMNRRYRHHIDILTHTSEKLHVCDPDAKLQLAPAPRKSRARATAVAHARPGRSAQRAASFRSRASSKRAIYLASAIL
jgi:3D (Asp-Asp-Asp) domain-containing protein